MQLSIIVAVARNGVIGREGRLPWCLSSDLKHFQKITMGHTLVMGRRTFESIGKLLPGRRTIVVTRSSTLPSDVPTAASLADALQQCGEAEQVFVIGGARMYQEALPLADQVYLTRVEAVVEGDVSFPLEQLETEIWQQVGDKPHQAGPRDEYPFRFQVYRRRSA